jgi:hypothetical protein
MSSTANKMYLDVQNTLPLLSIGSYINAAIILFVHMNYVNNLPYYKQCHVIKLFNYKSTDNVDEFYLLKMHNY